MRVPLEDPANTGPNLMPVIDVVFLLLIFFLVATRFDQEERELPVQLPEVVEAQPLAMTKDLVVNITRDGKYKVLRKEYTDKQLGSLLKEAHRKNPHQAVLIRGDEEMAWKYGVRVMGMCNKAGIENYRVAALAQNR